MPPMMQQPQAKPKRQGRLVVQDRDRGLSSSEAAARRRAHGPNELLDHPGHSVLQLVAQQFEDTLVCIPLTADAVSFALALSSSAGALTLSAFVEPLVIFLILVVNAAVGVMQETNAEKALEALCQIQSDHAAVLRDAEWAPALPARDLVLGDVVMVRVGDKVPADMRVLRLISSNLRVEQG
ncbi:calcium-transporting ATPase 1, endoplasmic reticulum-type-like [Hordeum vulgare subsp. vulgare]|uniref:calcium-transporting ATPase 1, endoplasmic reticulum-type-like n=1 Tax=Hordeum vulgare subsp. vulgare TaxID=112509 RepID=UPI001D1A34B6|nr:calcium-transporting ATPase 1, endoplasmic reticulum-type-like [Hordeum vulgare subsp. vulgare]